MPPRAMSSNMSRLRRFAVRKMISSMTSFERYASLRVQDLGLAELLGSEHLAQRLVVAGILKLRFEGIPDEVEEGRQQREPQPLRGWLGPLRELGQEGEYLFGSDG